MSGPELLRAWRSKCELTQEQAARLLGVSQSAFCEYEQGKKVPRIETAARIAKETNGRVPMESWVTPSKGAA